MSINETLQAACEKQDITGAVVVAGDTAGLFYYAKAFGASSLKEDPSPKPSKLDSTFLLASCTKLMTAIAALQCVERGQFTLDEDVTRLLPELKDIEILKGFEEGTEKPILVQATKKITLRPLLTHSSGIAYDVFNPIITRWRHSRGEEAHLYKGTLVHRCTVPLLFEPGDSFEYSTGPDWAGQMVERTNGMSLGSYMKKYIWDPLGITDMTFHLEERPNMLNRLPDMTERQGGANVFGTPVDPSGTLAFAEDKVWGPTTDDSGGAGEYGTMVDYQKILHSITAGDGKLLGAEMLEELFRPQLSDSAQAQFTKLLSVKEAADIMTPGLPLGTKIGHTLAGGVVMEDIEGRRRKGTLHWEGLPNLFWWADRAAGVCGVHGSQLIPAADPKSIGLFADVERAVYEKVRESRGEKE